MYDFKANPPFDCGFIQDIVIAVELSYVTTCGARDILEGTEALATVNVTPVENLPQFFV